MGLIKHAQDMTGGAQLRQRGRDCASLCAALDDPQALVRRWAARDLADCSDPASSAGVRAALLARLPREPEAAVRAIILSTLLKLADQGVVLQLLACLRSGEPALCQEIIGVLQQLPALVAPQIPALLRDSDSALRILTVNILESLRHADVEALLLEVIARDEHLNVCAAAVDLLGEVGSAAARLPLQQLKQRFAGEPYIAFAADLALRRLEEM
ncbi:HEAT repeat domain-containing protein [Duganella qianjiadongensis]|uniref:HEAT repeat domain-containing protein n=1 Tax=Duganella qianjiadongensis TaxID=2692176 RepID=A0ABW9VIB6_9BURK|nr:HEAT repeat domain-containing protein [Duganella qianjiadongensis]MYM39198.1 HEAT repeat domain-containing protein [Duganella qianjiadongensis]